MSSLGEIAASLGLPVFPCNAEKLPCTKHGFHEAKTAKPDILADFRGAGVALIGVPTGPVSGIVVIDVDIKHGGKGMDWLNANREALPETRTHKTKSGGLHLVFKYPDGHEIRNSQWKETARGTSGVAPGIDVRALGGYVIYPPSNGYSVADASPPADMPMWLIRACKEANSKTATPKASKPIANGHSEASGPDTAYGLAALDGECEEIRRAAFGSQEVTLNEAALKIGALIAGNQLSEAKAARALIAAASSMSNAPGERPWTHRDIEEKVKRGIRDGKAQPRRPKERILKAMNGNHPPVQPIRMDEMPEPPLEVYVGETENPKDHRTFPVTSFLEAQASLETKDFVEGLLVEETLSIVYGQSNAGKTFWVTDLGFHVAAGLTWNGREVEQGAVLYLALEGRFGIMNRIAAFKMARGMDDENIPFYVSTCPVNLLDPRADAETVVYTAKQIAAKSEIKIVLIVIDTVARAAAGGNENSSEDMGAFIKSLDLIKNETGAHVMGIHHSGKDETKGARGWSGLKGAIDTEIEVKDDEGRKTAEVLKQRDLPKGDVFGFSLEQVVLGQNHRKKDVTSCVVKHATEGASFKKDRRNSLKGQARQALDLLTELLLTKAQPGFGAPSGVSSVPEDWWRERFYDRTMPGAEQASKKKAFRRAADTLLERRFVVVQRGRVWTISSDYESEMGTKEGTE